MDDLTIILLCIGCPLIICALVGIEFYSIIKSIRKNEILNKIKYGNDLTINDFEIKSPAILYGKPIEIALKDGFIYFINEGKYFSAHAADFVSIENKNGKFTFRFPIAYIANAKAFTVKCDNTIFANKVEALLKSFNNEGSKSENEETESNKKHITSMTDSTRQKIKKAGLVMLAIGAIGAFLIVIISLLLYGKIYFYNGYDFTGWLWTICFILFGGGLIALGLTTPLLQKVILTSKGRFIIIGLCYVIFFVIFALLGHWLYYFITTLLFIAGGVIYIVFHYHNAEKENIGLSKAEILEKRAKNKIFYSNVMAIILAFALLISFMSAFLPKNNTDSDGIAGWTQCYKCNKTGKVRNDLGFYVTCPHCDGVGYLPD